MAACRIDGLQRAVAIVMETASFVCVVCDEDGKFDRRYSVTVM